MSKPFQDLLGAFDALTVGEQREVLHEILRRLRHPMAPVVGVQSAVEAELAKAIDHACLEDVPPLSDETLDQIANEAFLEYDAREMGNGRP